MFIDEKGLPLVMEKTFPIISDPEELRRALLRRNCLIHGTFMFRKSILDIVGMYDLNFRFFSDYALLLKISSKFHISNIKRVLYKSRIHPDRNSTRRVNERRAEARDSIKLLFKERNRAILQYLHPSIEEDYRGFRKNNLRILIFELPDIIKMRRDIQHNCIKTLASLGHQIHLIKLRGVFFESLMLESVEEICNQVSQIHPDFMFGVSYIELLSQILTTLKVPQAYLIVDGFSQNITDITKENVSSYCYFFSPIEAYVEKLQRLGFEHVFHLAELTNQEGSCFKVGMKQLIDIIRTQFVNKEKV
jgi:hypothetical protein